MRLRCRSRAGAPATLRHGAGVLRGSLRSPGALVPPITTPAFELGPRPSASCPSAHTTAPDWAGSPSVSSRCTERSSVMTGLGTDRTLEVSTELQRSQLGVEDEAGGMTSSPQGHLSRRRTSSISWQRTFTSSRGLIRNRSRAASSLARKRARRPQSSSPRAESAHPTVQPCTMELRRSTSRLCSRRSSVRCMLCRARPTRHPSSLPGIPGCWLSHASTRASCGVRPKLRVIPRQCASSTAATCRITKIECIRPSSHARLTLPGLIESRGTRPQSLLLRVRVHHGECAEAEVLLAPSPVLRGARPRPPAGPRRTERRRRGCRGRRLCRPATRTSSGA